MRTQLHHSLRQEGSLLRAQLQARRLRQKAFGVSKPLYQEPGPGRSNLTSEEKSNAIHFKFDKQRVFSKPDSSCEGCLEEHYKCVPDPNKKSCTRCLQTKKKMQFSKSTRGS